MKTITGVLAAVSFSVGLLGSALAAPVTPTFGTFGDLSQATFGGNGIPTDPTAFDVFSLGNGQSLTLGLAATPRFNNADLGNDGAGTYSAVAGLNDGTPGSTAGLLGTTWNFSFFAGITGTPTGQLEFDLGSLGLELFYDFDPGAGTDRSELGTLDLSLGSILLGQPLLFEGSENLAFGFLAVDAFGISSPQAPSFDPFAAGEYSFALASSVGEVAINVNVSAVPLPAPLALLLAAFAGLGIVARRKARAA